MAALRECGGLALVKCASRRIPPDAFTKVVVDPKHGCGARWSDEDERHAESGRIVNPAQESRIDPPTAPALMRHFRGCLAGMIPRIWAWALEISGQRKT